MGVGERIGRRDGLISQCVKWHEAESRLPTSVGLLDHDMEGRENSFTSHTYTIENE